MKNISFATIYKVVILLSVVYFLVLLTKLVNTVSVNSEVGRYQFHSNELKVLDTKTGTVVKIPR
jgi:hypothetical protein